MEAAAYLDVYLAPFLAQLARADITDLYVNRPEELWVETLGGAVERHDSPELTEAHLWRLEGVLGRDSDVDFEFAAFVGRVWWAGEMAAEFGEVGDVGVVVG